MTKTLLILAIFISLLINFFLVSKLLTYRKIISKQSIPLLERVYTSIASEVDLDRPVVFAGDSMVQRMNWNFLFQKISEKEKYPIIINRGIGGNTTKDLLRRFNDNILELNPSAIFIEIGTNDFVELNKDNKLSIEKEFIKNYKSIVHEALNHDKKLNIYLISIFPVIKPVERIKSIQEINQKLKELTFTSNRLHYIDCFDQFYDREKNIAKIAFLINENSPHLNDIGYHKWGELLSPYVLTAKIQDKTQQNLK